MNQQLVSALLATSILACPLFCKGGASCDVADGAPVVLSCCNECHKEETTHSPIHEPVPTDPNSEAPEKCCSCICGGAVVEDTLLQGLHLDASNWVALPAAEQFIAVIFEPQQGGNSWAPLPDDGMNPGRAIRCLMMSFLC